MNSFTELANLKRSYKKTQKEFWKGGAELFSLSLRDREKYDKTTNDDKFKEKIRLEHITTLEKYIAIRKLELQMAEKELDDIINGRSVENSVISTGRVI